MKQHRKHIIEWSGALTVLVLAALTMYPRFLAVQYKSQIQTRQNELQQLVNALLTYELETSELKFIESGIIDDISIAMSGFPGKFGNSIGNRIKCSHILFSDIWKRKTGLQDLSYPVTFLHVDLSIFNWSENPNQRVAKQIRWIATAPVPIRESDQDFDSFLTHHYDCMDDVHLLSKGSFAPTNGLHSAGALLAWATQYVQLVTPAVESLSEVNDNN